jgi:hypothetical protein
VTASHRSPLRALRTLAHPALAGRGRRPDPYRRRLRERRDHPGR